MSVTDEMVNRFLSWPLPESVNSDVCVTKDYGQRYGFVPLPQRTGTNLLTADEARQMLEHVLGSTTPSEKRSVPDGWKLVPAVPTEQMLDALGNSPWIIEKDTKVVDGVVTTTQREHRNEHYVVDGWQAMLAAAPEAPHG
jgi:hypothetical protein